MKNLKKSIKSVAFTLFAATILLSFTSCKKNDKVEFEQTIQFGTSGNNVVVSVKLDGEKLRESTKKMKSVTVIPYLKMDNGNFKVFPAEDESGLTFECEQDENGILIIFVKDPTKTGKYQASPYSVPTNKNFKFVVMKK